MMQDENTTLHETGGQQPWWQIFIVRTLRLMIRMFLASLLLALLLAAVAVWFDWP